MFVFSCIGGSVLWLVQQHKLHYVRVMITVLRRLRCVCEQATDSTFGAKLRENLHSNGRFKFDPKKPTDDFVVQHYAGPVTYSCTKFLDKNKDTLSPGKLTHCMACSSICFC